MNRASPGWILRQASEQDIDTIMGWFSTAAELAVWGGPGFRFPYTAASFREDCHWPAMASYVLVDITDQESGDAPLAFGQIYERTGRIHFARLVVMPGRRGEGIGRQLISCMMAAGRLVMPLPAYSLFVYRDNRAALRCYESLGFRITDYPKDQSLADECYFLTCPVSD